MIPPTTSPWLFIYFRPNIRVIQPEKSEPDASAKSGFKFVPRDELWLCEIGTGNGIIHKFSKSSIPLRGKDFIALARGFRWSGFIWPYTNAGVALTFSPEKSNDIIFYIPEEYIVRIYDMSAREYIYHHLSPNPPH